MHQRLRRSRHEPVVDEEILLDAEAHVSTFEIAGVIAAYAVTQRQVLRSRRGPDRVRLDESQLLDGALQRGWRKQAAPNGKAAQIVESNWHRLDSSVARR